MNGYVMVVDAHCVEGAIATANSINRNAKASICFFDVGMNEQQVKILEKLGNVVKVERTITTPHIKVPGLEKSYACLDSTQSGFDNIIYLQYDMLVLEDIRHLFEDVEEHFIMATKASNYNLLTNPSWERPLSHYLLPGITCFNPNFSCMNGGFFVITKDNLLILREGMEKYEEYFPKFHAVDQNLLNILLDLKGLQWTELPYEYNATKAHWRLYESICKFEVSVNFNKAQINDREVKVLHFHGWPQKPWTHPSWFREGVVKLWKFYRYID